MKLLSLYSASNTNNALNPHQTLQHILEKKMIIDIIHKMKHSEP